MWSINSRPDLEELLVVKEHVIFEKLDQETLEAVEEEVRALYEKYNPEKLTSMDTIMFRYKGREMELLKDIKDKYKDMQPVSEEHAASLDKSGLVF